MSHFLQKEYIIDDLRRWFDGSIVFSNTQGVSAFVEGIEVDEGIVSFLLRNPAHRDEAWGEDDVETSFESYGAVQLQDRAFFFSRMPNRQYSFGIKQRQFMVEHLPGNPMRQQINMLEAVNQFQNRRIYPMPRAFELLSEGTLRSCVLSEDVRLMKAYNRNSQDPLYLLVWRSNLVGFVEEGDVRFEEQYLPFQNLIMQDIAA